MHQDINKRIHHHFRHDLWQHALITCIKTSTKESIIMLGMIYGNMHLYQDFFMGKPNHNDITNFNLNFLILPNGNNDYL
jgi:hypothetical protein